MTSRVLRRGVSFDIVTTAAVLIGSICIVSSLCAPDVSLIGHSQKRTTGDRAAYLPQRLSMTTTQFNEFA
jgi:hypothetical protein